jgi:TusE/DsrC/DsvC family sulfur relay protein
MRADVFREPLLVNGRELATDDLGYLLDPSDWNEQVAEILAEREAIELSGEHWTVLHIVRAGFAEYRVVPEARSVLREMRKALGESLGTRDHLHRLFPYGYGPQVCKIAGMRMPRKVMLDV